MLIAANLLLNYDAETETFDSGDIIFNEGETPDKTVMETTSFWYF